MDQPEGLNNEDFSATLIAALESAGEYETEYLSELEEFMPDLRKVRQAMEGQRFSASFACGGTIPLTDDPESKATPRCVKIYWSLDDQEQAHKVILPLNNPSTESSPPALQRLITDCLPATFGRGSEDVLDPNYRRAGKMDPEKFATTFHPADAGILKVVERILLPSISSKQGNFMKCRSLSAELYKLNVYSGPNGLFRPHVDTPRSVTQVGSLVVCLPSPFEGGDLLVRHHEKEMNFNWGSASSSTIQWAAFYSDCCHEIKTVTSGERITLTYNLYASDPEPALAMASGRFLEPQTLPLYTQMEALFHNPRFLKRGGVIGIYCAHAYAHTSKTAAVDLARTLKGSDLVFYSVLVSLGATVDIRPVLNAYDSQDEEEGEVVDLVGTELHRFVSTSASTEHDRFREIVTDDWPHHRLSGIIWLNRSHHNERAFSYIAYGNDAEVETCYSAAAILAHIPSWESRRPQ
ncbi:hypothetical protein BDV25DRAFT_144075 [Aspergillus avenaceus]|uniref:Fe2OG dioxygenase domain-containing protein n=1 Tax=Aspergillus avenaceus TaxID=36643 RepID=A0A5N6TI59_ASPAV|nr:hypothetical protein BDV25DRAFT_144075 [Aspergillus avenaceus]